jgi:hypothetical protein
VPKRDTVRFMAVAIFLTGDLLRECALSSRTSAFDQKAFTASTSFGCHNSPDTTQRRKLIDRIRQQATSCKHPGRRDCRPTAAGDLPQRTGLATARHDQDDSYQKILRLAACFGAPTSGVSPKGVLKDAMKFEFMVDDITSTAVVVGNAGMSPIDVHVGRLGPTFMKNPAAGQCRRSPRMATACTAATRTCKNRRTQSRCFVWKP